jgi:hypothetical protein
MMPLSVNQLRQAARADPKTLALLPAGKKDSNILARRADVARLLDVLVGPCGHPFLGGLLVEGGGFTRLDR